MKTLHKILILSLILCTSFTAQAQNDEDMRFGEIGYSATSFEDVGASGYYGIGATILPWNIKQNLNVGFHFSYSMNYGLCDPSSMLAQIGPALGCYITPTLKAAMPLDVMCAITDGEDDSTTLSWGMGLTPTIYIGKKVGVYVGPSLTVPFSKGTKTTFGFKAGFYF